MVPQEKKRKLTITFDPAARHEFLTGFHKRKLQRIRHAQEIAEKKAREERRQERKKIREERAAEYQQILEKNQKLVRELNGDADSTPGSDSDGAEDEQWEGFEEPPAIDYEVEYIDEDKYATVTIEEVNPSKIGLYKLSNAPMDKEQSHENNGNDNSHNATSNLASGLSSGGKPAWKTDKPKRKRKKYRYQSKEERKKTQLKERLVKKKRAQAGRGR